MPISYRDCEWCGFVYPAKNSRTRFCSDAHRAAANRARRNAAAAAGEPESAPVAEAPALLAGVSDLQQLAALVAEHLRGQVPDAAETVDDDKHEPTASPDSHGSVYFATHEALSKAGRQDTWSGLSALVLAGRLDDAHRETGSALKALAAGLREQMVTALSHPGAGAHSEPTDGSDDDEQAPPAPPTDMLAAHRAASEARRVGISS